MDIEEQIDKIIENLIKRSQFIQANRGAKASLDAKLEELGISKEKLIELMRRSLGN